MTQALGPAGYTITGSGGGGTDGGYYFASLEELDTIIAQWRSIRDAISADRERLLQAQQSVVPPADDEASTTQATAVIESLDRAIEHNDAMRTYADDYLDKLTAARARYLTDDHTNADLFRAIRVD